jgi:hypothetical protein
LARQESACRLKLKNGFVLEIERNELGMIEVDARDIRLAIARWEKKRGLEPSVGMKPLVWSKKFYASHATQRKKCK